MAVIIGTARDARFAPKAYHHVCPFRTSLSYQDDLKEESREFE